MKQEAKVEYLALRECTIIWSGHFCSVTGCALPLQGDTKPQTSKKGAIKRTLRSALQYDIEFSAMHCNGQEQSKHSRLKKCSVEMHYSA